MTTCIKMPQTDDVYIIPVSASNEAEENPQVYVQEGVKYIAQEGVKYTDYIKLLIHLRNEEIPIMKEADEEDEQHKLKQLAKRHKFNYYTRLLELSGVQCAGY